MLRDRLFHGLRTAVVRTAEFPIARDVYRAVYALQGNRARRLLRRTDGVEAIFIRGSSYTRVSPGLSDLDLFVVLDESCPAAVELRATERIGRLVRVINVGAPLIREVHFFTRPELGLLARLPDTLYAGLLFDCAPIGIRPALPEMDNDPGIAREALLREVCFRAATVVQHLYAGGIVGKSLAARAHAKTLVAMLQLEQGGGSMEGLRRAYATGARVPADFRDVLALHRRIDAVLPDAPEVVADEPWSAHPAIDAAVAPVREWFRPLERAPGIVGAMLSAEGARRADLRFYVLLDPANAGAESTFVRIGSTLRRRPFPRDGFSRFPWPIVITPKQYARSIFQRWTSTEPLTRLRHGVTISGTPVAPRATTGEMTRGLVLDWIGSANRVHELFAGERSAKNLQCVSDAVLGLAPALETLARTGTFVTRPRHTAEEGPAFIRSLRTRQNREELLDALRAVAQQSCSALVTSSGGERVPSRNAGWTSTGQLGKNRSR